MTLLRQGGWTRWPTEVPSNPYHSVILWRFWKSSSPFFQINHFSGLSVLHCLWCQYWKVLWLASQRAGALWKGLADSICMILRDAIAGQALERLQEFCFCHFSVGFWLFPEVCVSGSCGKNCRACCRRTPQLRWFRRGWLTHSSDLQSWSGWHETVFKSFSALLCPGWNTSFLWWGCGLIVYSLFFNLDALEQAVERKGGNGWKQLLFSTR